MPKNPTTQILRRWRAMDKQLASHTGLCVSKFASWQKVSTKTVRRDLATFHELGHRVYRLEFEDERDWWSYEPGVGRLFTDPPADKG